MENVKISYIGQGKQYQEYSAQDIALINTSLINGAFGNPGDYIEYFIKDLDGTVIDYNYNDLQYTIGSNLNPITGVTNKVFLDPEMDARDLGYSRGAFNIKYNFLTTHLQSTPLPNSRFWIKEISTSRTEIKAARQDLSNGALLESFGAFNAILSANTYYPTFYLNFGADELVIGVNAAYIEENGIGYVVFKLYEPLPDSFDLKSTFWVVTEAADSAEFNVSIEVAAEPTVDTERIKGPNFKVPITDRIGQTTPYYNYASLLGTIVTSSFQQIQSLANQKGIQINVDYSNFENFIHFSSATERLYNFVYKVQQIESASYGLTQTNTTQGKILLQKGIDNITANFDPWEYYMYFNSGSASWPKVNNITPYSLYSVTSSQAVNWLGSTSTLPAPGVMSMYWSASYYDNQNKDWVLYATPQYILDDDANAPYVTFLNMIGQHFDNIWIYLKDVTNHYSAENNPFVGISMDLVADALKSFGVKLYTNTSVSDNIYYSLFGINQTGSNLPVTASQYSRVVYASSSIYPSGSIITSGTVQPTNNNFYLSSSLFLPPVGEDLIFRYVLTFPYSDADFAGYWDDPNSIYDSASVYYGLDDIAIAKPFPSLPGTQIQNEIYKRIYHNLPYLLKTRGTERGVKALIACYGIPADILTPHEYGGYNYLQVPGIQEISNDRILTGSVLQISSSLLSPFATLQYYSNDLQKTSINVEAAFSPADSINASITSSGYVTSSTQPGYFNIMQLIGAPNLQYSSSYIPLEQLSNTYFKAEYTSRYDVWDFIRLIKFFNNSLFKMLRDWVPARSSADTGIVIKSHMLERNKYPRKEPTYTTSSYDADYILLYVSGSSGGAITQNTNYVQTIPIQYNGTASAALTGSIGTVYVSSSNDIQKYTGEFDGSYIVGATNYFPQEEVSSYIYPWTSSAYSNGPLFLTYSVSPLYQNVFTPVRSQRFLDLDFNTTQFAPVNYGLITKSLEDTILFGNIYQSQQPYSQYAFIQDYNYYAQSYVIPRYSGSYLSGLKYNTYTPGDISYGKNPVINYYSDKLGLFTQIATSSFLPGKVNVAMAYLADISGGLYELNQNNRNWIDVQNIFVAGTQATIKQFDNKKYSNQVSTDGIKTIYNSGYNYTPQLYFTSGTDSRLYFEYVGVDTTTQFRGFVSGTTNSYISGAASPRYPVVLDAGTTVRKGNIYNYLDGEDPVSPNFATGSTPNVWPSFTASIAGQRTFTINLGLNIEFPDPQTFGSQTVEYSWGAYKGGTQLVGTSQLLKFTSQYSPGGLETGSIIGYGATGAVTIIDGPYYSNTVNGPFNVIINGIPQGVKEGTIVYGNYQFDIGGNPQSGLLIISTTGDVGNYVSTVNAIYPTLLQTVEGGGAPTTPINVSSTVLNLDYTTPPVNLLAEDKIVFKLTQNFSTTDNYTASFTAGISNSYLTSQPATVGQGSYPYATVSSSGFINSIVDVTPNTSTIVFNKEVSGFTNYQFVPFFISGGVIYSSSLYGNYGDVNYPLDPQFGDKIVMSDFSGISQELDVVSSELLNGSLVTTVAPQVLENWMLNPKLIYKFLLLRRYDDEQNVIVIFNKNPGPTSYGFLVPDTISPAVVDNINTLQAAVQSQILNGQAPVPEGL